MKRFILFWGLLCAVAFPCYAQNWTTQDSLRLQQLLKGEGEVKLNPDVLKEIDMGSPFGTPKAGVNKPWLDFDDTLPVSLPGEPKKTIKLSLRPYSANTKYNWDPIYQKKIEIKKDTWPCLP